MRAELHPMNQQRLAALHSYDILDTEQDDAFTEIVELASEICDTPISLVSLVDEHRQWFKAEVGFGTSETPIEQSICSHVILQNDLVEINDTHSDQRTADNPLCSPANGARFYAGAPLITQDGHAIGTLCVLDNKPRTLNALQRKSLEVLSRQVVRQIELHKALQTQAVLQSETDHRVKNSLQSMSAIVRVYTRTVTDDAALDALGAIQRRIDAVAALHEELQDTDGRNTVDTDAYLSSVVSLLRETSPSHIDITADIAPIVMRSDHAANLAMIISEFVANSIKHAFPDTRQGQITVSLSVCDQGKYRLECADNGVGDQSTTQEPTRTQGIGLSLVSAAAANLSGKTQSDLTPDGSRLVLEFEDHPVAGAVAAE